MARYPEKYTRPTTAAPKSADPAVELAEAVLALEENGLTVSEQPVEQLTVGDNDHINTVVDQPPGGAVLDAGPPAPPSSSVIVTPDTQPEIVVMRPGMAQRTIDEIEAGRAALAARQGRR